MSLSPFVTTHPEMLSSAAGELAGIGSAMAASNRAAAAPTSGVVPAAADTIHSLLVSTLQTNAASYAAAEAANAVAAG